nr:polysaccharide pyruvyl transferase family protein [Bacteroidota bacterium]
MKTITVLGNYSGRNAGDNAILGNLLHDFSLVQSNIIFQIPTLSPRFIKSNFGQYQVRPMGMMPWNFAFRNFGWPLYKAMTKTQMVLITDNILFDRKFNNPFVNNLKSIAFFSSFCKRKGIPIVLYNASIGPIDHAAGAAALQNVLDASALVITRDVQTKNLIEDLKLRHPKIVVKADCALNTQVPSLLRIQEIVEKEDLYTNPNGTIGLNVNAYVDNWSKKGSLSRDEFCKIIAGTADRLIEQLDVDILFIVTQVMDIKITRECVGHIQRKSRVRLVDNKKYTYQELTALIERVEVLAGLRTHTLIFSAATGIPMISINAYPKSVAFLETIGMGNWNISLKNISVEKLSGLIQRAWNERGKLRTKMVPIIELEKKKARESVRLVMDLMQ